MIRDDKTMAGIDACLHLASPLPLSNGDG